MKVGIIGGGFTGLTTAYKLLKDGNKVTVYEKEKEVGGLAQSFNLEGTDLEIYYHHIFKTDTFFIELAKELGVEDKIMWLESSVCIVRDGEVFPFISPLDLLKFKPLPFIDRIRAGVVTLFLQKYKNWESFKNVSAYEWMMKYAGKNVTEVIWEPLLKGKYHNQYKEVSMAWMWARIHIRANSRKGLGEKEMLGYMRGGFQVFIDALVAEIEKMGGEIRSGVSIQSINSSPKGKVVIKVSGKEEVYDKSLITVPSPVLKNILHPNMLKDKSIKKYVDGVDRVKYLGAICLVFTSSQKITDYYWHNINDMESPFLVFINHTRLVDRKFYGGKYVYYIAKYLPVEDNLYTMDKKELEDLWFKNLKKIFPIFDRNKIQGKFLFKSPYAQHVVDTEYFSFVPELKNPMKNIYFSNFSLIYPEDRGMNFSVREGIKMYNILLDVDDILD